MASQEEEKSFLDVGIPATGLFAPLGDGRVGYYALRTIDNDYRIGMVADRLGTNKLLAKTLLSQVEMGNVQLQYLDRQAREQGVANQELRNLSMTAASAHKAVLDLAERHEVRMDAYVEETVGAIRDGASLISGTLEEGFDRTVDAIYESGERIIDAIGVATYTITAELKGLGDQLQTSNQTLKEIARYLQAPGDTKVKELLVRSTQLVDEGMKSHGKWRYDNWRDALGALLEAANCAIGKTNPMVWFQVGFLTWKCNERSRDEVFRKKKLSEARDAFDAAARLFTSKSSVYFSKSVRHKAHMQYLLGDYQGAFSTIAPLIAKAETPDVVIEGARYAELIGKRKLALDCINWCVSNHPTYSISIFGEPDFKNISGEMVGLVARNLSELQHDLRGELTKLATAFVDRAERNIDETLKCGTYEQHKKAQVLLTELLQAKNYLLAYQLARSLRKLLREIEEADTLPYEHARIYVFYGARRRAADLLQKLVQRNVRVVSTIITDKVILTLGDLVAPMITAVTTAARDEATRAFSMLESVEARLRRLRASVGLPTEFTKEYLEVVGKRKQVSTMDFTEATKFLDAVKQFHEDAFGDVPARVSENISRRPPKTPVFTQRVEWQGKQSGAKVARYLFASICLLAEEFPSACSPSVLAVAEFHRALESYNASGRLGRHKLEKVAENGLGSHWKFCFCDERGGRMEAQFFAPHVKSATLFRKAVPFKPGDTIAFKSVLPDLIKSYTSGVFREILEAL